MHQFMVKKPFQGSMCDNVYDASSELNKHVESVHVGIKYQCSLCKKGFS